MTVLDVVSLIATVAALVLAVGAIWLSIVFFRMSSEASKATTEAAKGIAASVERLEKLFDKLYSDTFSMMRDTVSDMRKHMWPADDPESTKAIEEVERKADDKIAELKKGMEEQLSSILQTQQIAGDQVMAVRREMRHLLDRAIMGSRQVETEAREETIREHLVRELRTSRRIRSRTTVDDVVSKLRGVFPINRIVVELERMKAEGLISLNPAEPIGPETEIRFVVSRDAKSEGRNREDR